MGWRFFQILCPSQKDWTLPDEVGSFQAFFIIMTFIDWNGNGTWPFLALIDVLCRSQVYAILTKLFSYFLGKITIK